ncbi:MAG: hypothetical protein NTZ05_05760 [Chloroflexi bacterium]|nr:hypothetical protein [Chloroflexota bacterium]
MWRQFTSGPRKAIYGVALLALAALGGAAQTGLIPTNFGGQAANCADVLALFGGCKDSASTTRQATLYDNTSASAGSMDLNPVKFTGDLPNLGAALYLFNDKASSVRVEGNDVAVALYADPDFKGSCIILNEGVHNLAQLTLAPDGVGADNHISSVRFGIKNQ